jgi:hypothetical protein
MRERRRMALSLEGKRWYSPQEVLRRSHRGWFGLASAGGGEDDHHQVAHGVFLFVAGDFLEVAAQGLESGFDFRGVVEAPGEIGAAGW